MPRPQPLVSLHGAVNFDRLVPFDSAPGALPLAVNDLLVLRRAAGGDNLSVSVGDIQTHGGSVNIADLLGGVNNDMLFRTGGVWTGTGATGLSYNGVSMNFLGDNISISAGGALAMDDGGNFSMAGSGQFLATAGSQAAPPIAFLLDPDTGWLNSAVNQISAVCAGSQAWLLNSLQLRSSATNGPGLLNRVIGDFTLPNVLPDHSNTGMGLSAVGSVMGLTSSSVLVASIDGAGSLFILNADEFRASNATGPAILNAASGAAIPNIRPDRSDVNTGIAYDTSQLILRAQSRNILIVDGPNNEIVLGGARFVASNANGPAVNNSNPNLTAPVFIPRKSDIDTGLSAPPGTTDKLSLIAGAVEGLRLTEANGGVILVVNADKFITAFAGGGQGNLTFNKSYNIVSVVATTGDAVTLPASFDVNSTMYIKNDGVNAMDVFPNTGDDLGQGVDTAVSVAAGTSISFLATVADTTWTQI